ncbi:MAG: hypothetical protein Q7S41_00910 [Candidatus Limnocylindria bacterium]|nr:hypothetical protein [Candidatus Limnocylindria bacterium]
MYLYVTPGELLVERALAGFPEEIRQLGVETYEGLRQVELSACHELFHYVCWNDPRYRHDGWVTGSFLRQGDHANPVEFFADIPTNFRDVSELPPPIRAHFAPLIDGSPMPYDLSRPPDWPIDPATLDLATFRRWLAGKD